MMLLNTTGALDDDGRQPVTPPIRGRAAELKLIDGLIADIAERRGGVLVIEGPPGIGKSRLLTEVIARAENGGVRTLFGEAFEYQRNVPFFPLFMATLRAEPPVGDPDALRRLGSAADLRYWVVHDLRAAIGAAASTIPLAIVLEDIQWADDATLFALRSLTGPRSGAPVLWVMTASTGAGGPAVRETVSLLERRGATFVRLPALSPNAVAEIVQDAVRARADSSLLSLAAKAHGNPFLLMELLGGLAEEDRLTVSGGRAEVSGDNLPSRLGAGMRQRLDGLPEAVREVVQVAAVLPDRFSAGLLAAMLDRRPAALVSAVHEAARVDLLAEDGDQLRFRHGLLRDATRQSLPRSLRRAMERQSAAVMLEMGSPPEEVATQLACSAEVGDQAAIAALRQAARSVGQCNPSSAADLARRAVELLPAGDSARGPLVAETVVLLNRASRYQEAQELADTALATEVSQEEEAEIRLRSAAGNEEPERRIAENRRALQLAGINDVTRARHQAWLAYFEAINGLHGHDRSAATEAVGAATACGDLESQIVSQTAVALLDYHDGYALRAMKRMDEIDALTRSGEVIFGGLVAEIHRASLIVFVGDLDEAEALVRAGIGRARRERDAMALPSWAVLRALVDAASGRLAAARATIEELPRPVWGNNSEVNVNRMLVMSDVAVRTDDRKSLQDLVSEALELYPSTSPLVSCGAAYVVALAAWYRGDAHEAVRWLNGQNSRVITPLWPNVFDQLICMSRVAAAAGDAGLRARVLASIEVLERERPGVPPFAAVARHTRGILEGDPDALLEAANTLRTSRPLLYAGAAEDAGGELARDGRKAQAIEQLNAAFDTFVKSEAVADARRVGRVLRGLGAQRRIVAQPRDKSGWDSLTDAELKVVDLIAAGATNREAAACLHLSPHTVKTHVRNAFAKLGINSRGRLPELIRGSGAVSSSDSPERESTAPRP